jgi:hypothetical protein
MYYSRKVPAVEMIGILVLENIYKKNNMISSCMPPDEPKYFK